MKPHAVLLFPIFFLQQEQLAPWYRWWKTTVNIRLVMESPEQQQDHQQGTSRSSITPGQLNEETTDTTTSKCTISINEIQVDAEKAVAFKV